MSLRNAVAHLTALRIPPRTRVPLVNSLHYFPWVSAAHGSINILCFLAALRLLPMPVACLIAVTLPQALAGFGPWRGLMEAVRGIHTRPGHGFRLGFRPDARGLGVVLTVTTLNWLAFMMLMPDWQVRAAFVFPILGMCAHTGAFLLYAPPPRDDEPLAARRRVRAGFLTTAQLFLAFLFPVRAAFFILAFGGLTAWTVRRLRHPKSKTGVRERLTLQTAAVVTIAAETAVLTGLYLAGRVLFRWE